MLRILPGRKASSAIILWLVGALSAFAGPGWETVQPGESRILQERASREGEWLQVSFHLENAAPTLRKPLWFVRFFDSTGSEHSADIHSSMEPPSGQFSAASNEVRSCFRTRPGTTRIAAGIIGGDANVQVADFAIEAKTPQEILSWMQELDKTLPPLPPPGDATPQEIHALRASAARMHQGQPLRLLLLGDSIMNDLGNSLLDLRLASHFPHDFPSGVEMFLSVRGATGCWYYREPAQLEACIFRYNPDLLLIGGISHRLDHEAVAAVVAAVRKRLPACEIVLMTGAVHETGAAGDGSIAPEVKARHLDQERAFFTELQRIAAEHGAAAFDLRSAWEGAVAASQEPPAHFQRDPIHANDRGKALLGALVADWLTSRMPEPNTPPFSVTAP